MSMGERVACKVEMYGVNYLGKGGGSSIVTLRIIQNKGVLMQI